MQLKRSLLVSSVTMKQYQHYQIEIILMAAKAANLSINGARRKLALVIGIDEYDDGQNLYNSVNDARKISSALKNIGFLIEGGGPKLNLKHKDMCHALVDFEDSIREGDMVVFYFSGHGKEWEHQNYLIPADNFKRNDRIKISGSDLRDRAINVQDILVKITDRKPFVTILFLDCCRTYRLHNENSVKQFKSDPIIQSHSFNPLVSRDGSFIAFACTPGTTADDEEEEETNSLFTKHLLNHIETPNGSILSILTDVTNGVVEESYSRQIPYVISRLNHENVCLYEQTSGFVINIPSNARWEQNGITVAGGNGRRDGLNQLNYPRGLYVDDDQTVYVADTQNNRIVKWKSGATRGEVVAGGNGEGKRIDQLNRPTDVTVDKRTDSLIICDWLNRRVMRWFSRSGTTNGEIMIQDIACGKLTMDHQRFLYVTDYKESEVRRYKMGDTQGTLVAGGNGQGVCLNKRNSPHYVFVDREQSIYVSDYWNHRVMKWMKGAKEGIVVAGGRGAGDDLTQLFYPEGVFVDQLNTIYVADSGNHRVMRWRKGMTQGDVIVGGNGRGAQVNQFYYPMSLSFDRHGNLYVADARNDRVQRFSIE